MQQLQKKLTIVGAGLSGLSCCNTLKDILSIKVFEKSKGIGGRAATRRIMDYKFDHGANYLSLDIMKENEIEFVKNLVKSLDTENKLTYIKEPIYLLDKWNTIKASNKDSEKLTFPDGINYLAKSFKQEVVREVFVDHLKQKEGKWQIFDKNQELLNESDFVLLNPPVPQTLEIIKKSQFEDSKVQDELIFALSKGSYYQQISVSVGVNQDINDRFPFYALVNIDKENDVWWLSIENKKQGHVPDGKFMVIAQMSNNWSVQNWDSTKIQVEVIQKIEDILKVQLRNNVDFVDIQKWRYSLPQKQVDANLLKVSENQGLFFGGDGIKNETGKGRLGIQLLQGHQLGELIKSRL